MQRLCFAKRLVFSYLDLPRYLSPHHLLPLLSHDAPTLRPYLHRNLSALCFFFCFPLRPDASDTFRTYILRILLLMNHLLSLLYNLTL